VNYIHPRRHRVKAFLDVHSYSQEVLPPGCNGYKFRKGDKKTVMTSAKALAGAMSHKGKKYTTGMCAKIMYPCSGVAHDWAYSKGIKNSFCVEVRPGSNDDDVGFVLPPRQILPTAQELLAGVLSLTSKAVPAYKFNINEVREMAAYQAADMTMPETETTMTATIKAPAVQDA